METNGVLLLDQFVSHIHDQFKGTRTKIVNLSGGYTSVCQPSDVVASKSLKCRPRGAFKVWNVYQYQARGDIGKLPTRRRQNDSQWQYSYRNCRKLLLRLRI